MVKASKEAVKVAKTVNTEASDMLAEASRLIDQARSLSGDDRARLMGLAQDYIQRANRLSTSVESFFKS